MTRGNLGYPLGTVTGRRALAVRTIDSTIHTWDLARSVGADERLEDDLVRRAGRDPDRSPPAHPVSAGPGTPSS